MSRVYNFSAGPACLPEEVLRQCAAEMLEYGTSGMSVMEMSHRSKDFEAILDQAEADLRELVGIPENYKVLFLQGGGNTQFAMVPMNLMRKGQADYILTGQWAKKAAKEAEKLAQKAKARVEAMSAPEAAAEAEAAVEAATDQVEAGVGQKTHEGDAGRDDQRAHLEVGKGLQHLGPFDTCGEHRQ